MRIRTLPPAAWTRSAASSLGLLIVLLCTAAAARADSVRTESGLIEGITLASGVHAWLGVPMAAPPLRELRWKAPQPAPKWSGVLHADRYAPMCLQTLRTRTMNHYFGNEATSEDCLYLNVWTPADPMSGRELPATLTAHFCFRR